MARLRWFAKLGSTGVGLRTHEHCLAIRNHIGSDLRLVCRRIINCALDCLIANLSVLLRQYLQMPSNFVDLNCSNWIEALELDIEVPASSTTAVALSLAFLLGAEAGSMPDSSVAISTQRAIGSLIPDGRFWLWLSNGRL